MIVDAEGAREMVEWIERAEAAGARKLELQAWQKEFLQRWYDGGEFKPMILAPRRHAESTRRLVCSIERLTLALEMRRCRTCYLPMPSDLRRMWWECELCGRVETAESVANRSSWQRFVDRVTGLEF